MTDREYAHASPMKGARGVTVTRVGEAVALVGLYLRTQGKYVISHDPGMRLGQSNGLYFWVGAREHLPAGWRWYSACVQHSSVTDDDHLAFLGGSVFQRVARCLQARDQIHRCMNRRQDNEVADDALTALDNALVLLMGAFDACARVAHVSLGFAGDQQHQAAWQKVDNWLKSVRKEAPDLANLVARGTPGYYVVTILRLLRNTLHGAGLPALGVGTPGRRDGTLVGLPVADSEQILSAVRMLGGEESWGIQSLIPGRFHADLGQLIEVLLPRCLELLNQLMEATPVERLLGVRLCQADDRPPDDHAFAPETRLSIRWQLGIGPAS